MDGDKTIEESAPPQPDEHDEPIDPEDQETVMFGQRHLFQEVEIAGAARRQEVLKQKKPRRRARASADDDWDAEGADPDRDTLDLSPEDAQTQPNAAGGSDAEPGEGTHTNMDAEEAATDETREAAGSGKAGADAQSTTTTRRRTGSRKARAKGDKAKVAASGRKANGSETETDGAEDELSSADGEDAPSERRVAERRPGDEPQKRLRRKGTQDLSSNCRICGRQVGWPRARRFRGARGNTHGFRCDTCGNVFCSTHVLRVSSFWESLLHHGRFRCLLCELGQSMKQHDEPSDQQA